MSIRLPSTRITPLDVITYCKKRGQKPTVEEAEQWLSKQKKYIEGMMGNIIEDNLEKILDEATLRAYPDPIFDQRYRRIDDALTTAADDYGTQIDKEFCGSSHTEAEMIEVVRRSLLQLEKFTACIAYDLEFGTPCESFKDKKVTHRTKRAHITIENGDVTAKVIEDDCSTHESGIFMPETLRNVN
ncbi:hypothetical protein RBB75_03935 [Tunturibacter empetritectus]|uniref:Uncharacterized protein n=1 Tax=Tunturiibacter empetritectus TaxID=3069691 RepID=A0AAU7ZER7_9BACT